MSKKRVVITGLGIVSPVGNTVNDAWNNILAGKSGITNITAITRLIKQLSLVVRLKNLMYQTT